MDIDKVNYSSRMSQNWFFLDLPQFRIETISSRWIIFQQKVSPREVYLTGHLNSETINFPLDILLNFVLHWVMERS